MSKISFQHVTVHAKANIYFDGKVVSHSIVMEDGAKKTLGLIYPGRYHFNTELAEKMEIIAGHCKVTLDGKDGPISYEENQSFDVPAKSGFTIEVNSCTCEYVCTFII